MAMGAMAGVAALGTLQSMEAQKQSAEYNAKLSERDAKVNKIQALDARLRGLDQEDTLREQEQELIASQMATTAASGFITDDATGVQLQEFVSRSVARDIQATRTNAIREAWGLETTGTNAMARAELDRVSGRNQATATLIGGAAQVASIYAASPKGATPAKSSGPRMTGDAP